MKPVLILPFNAESITRQYYFLVFLVRFPEMALTAFFFAVFIGATDLLAGAVAKCSPTLAAS